MKALIEINFPLVICIGRSVKLTHITHGKYFRSEFINPFLKAHCVLKTE